MTEKQTKILEQLVSKTPSKWIEESKERLDKKEKKFEDAIRLAFRAGQKYALEKVYLLFRQSPNEDDYIKSIKNK